MTDRSGFLPALLVLLLTVAPGPSAAAPGVAVETIATGLDHPWSLVFLPDGALLVTERSGGLWRLAADGSRTPIAGVPPVYVRSQAGLFEVLLAPDFAVSGRLYLSYAHGSDEANTLRVATAVLAGDRLADLRVIFDALPWRDTPVHYGGRMAFLPDGTLLVTSGDGFDYRESAWDLTTHFGKTIRIAPDGTAPADNPFVDAPGALPEIWTRGHRNPQGLVVDPETGIVWQHEHGPRGGDELNRLAPGVNYGWPAATFGVDYNGALVSPYTELEGTRQPVLQWTPSIAPAGLCRYAGDLFPAWRGDLLVASLAEKTIRRIDLDGERVVGQEIVFPELSQRFRDVRCGPDGAIYLLTDSAAGEILRVVPAP